MPEDVCPASSFSMKKAEVFVGNVERPGKEKRT